MSALGSPHFCGMHGEVGPSMLSDNCQRAPLLSPEPPCLRSSLPCAFCCKSLAPIAMKNISLCSSKPPGCSQN